MRSPSDNDRSTPLSDALRRKAQLQNEKLQFQLSIYKKDFIPKAVAKRVFAQFITAAKTRSIAGVSRLVTLIRMAPDSVSACELMRKEQLDLWAEMSRSEWFKREEAAPAPAEPPPSIGEGI